jgi:peptidoglycan/LPS O-acetylase OafA/YrhL
LIHSRPYVACADAVRYLDTEIWAHRIGPYRKSAHGESVAEDQLGRVRYIAAFDGMRALCIAAVIVFHVISTDHPWLENLARRGWCGVDVFFVLSGFLITWIIVVEFDHTGAINLPRFYARRALRLQPAYFSGLFGFTLLLFLFHREKFFIVMHAMPYFLTYTMNFAAAFAWIPFPPYGQAWSLCIEEQFYLCWPWTLRRFGSRKCFRIALGVVIFVMLYRSGLYAWLNRGHLGITSDESLDRLFYGTDTRIDTILTGCATALALREPALQKYFQRLREWRWFTAVASVIALVAFVWATGGAFKGGWRSTTIGFTLMAVTTAFVILAVFLQPQSMLSRWLSWPPMVFVGKISYGIYLFHPPFWEALARLMGLRFGAVGSVRQELVALVLVFVGSIFIAWAHFQLVEKRFLALRDRFDSKRKAMQATAAAASERGI